MIQVHPIFLMSINAWGCFCELGDTVTNSLSRKSPMDTDQKAQMQAHVRAIIIQTIAILNENGIGVAGAPPPSLVLGNFCWLIK